jgi:hypothetical protein
MNCSSIESSIFNEIFFRFSKGLGLMFRAWESAYMMAVLTLFLSQFGLSFKSATTKQISSTFAVINYIFRHRRFICWLFKDG